LFFFFFNDTATTEIYTLSLHDALPIWFPTEFTLSHIDLHFPGGSMTAHRSPFAIAVWSYVVLGILAFGLLVAGSTPARAQSNINGGLQASPNLSATSHLVQ